MKLQLEDIGLVYQKGTAFEETGVVGVSLAIEQGERVGIAGPIGSGKSSLLTVMGGIVPPDSGSLVIDEVEIGGKDRIVRGSIGVAFQSPENSLFEATVFDDVAFAPRSLELEDHEVNHRVYTALETVGLELDRFGHRNPFSLSSGEQRRVALAGVLSLEPRFLLLDEPTAYLDPHTREDLIARLVKLNQERETTIVIVGHDMDELAAFSERIVIMDAGRMVADAPARELLIDEELLQRYGLEAPGTVRLCRLLADATGHRVEPVLEEAQAVDTLFEVLRGDRSS